MTAQIVIPTRRLGDLARVINGFSVRPEMRADHGYRVLDGADLYPKAAGGRPPRFISCQPGVRFLAAVLQPKDVLITRVSRGFRALVFEGGDIPTVAGSSLIILREAENSYVGAYLQTPEGHGHVATRAQEAASTLAGAYRFSAAAISEIQVPVLPLADRNATGLAALHASEPTESDRLRQELIELRQRLQAAEVENRVLRERSDSQASQLERSQVFVTDLLVRISQGVSRVLERLDSIDSGLLRMAGEVAETKQARLSEAERDRAIAQQLDAICTRLEADERKLEQYVAAARRWLAGWDLLDDLSKRLIPTAGYLLDLLQRANAPDCSPALLQFCRAVEHEVRLKVFVAYHQYVRDAADGSRSGGSDVRGPLRRFAEKVMADDRQYMLGEMCSALRAAGTSLQPADPPLMSDFRRFLHQRFQLDVARFAEELDELRENYRNRAAHPGEIARDEAEAGHQLCRLLLAMLLSR